MSSSTKIQYLENDLCETNSCFLRLLEGVPVCMFFTNLPGHNIFVNDRYLATAELTVEEMIGNDWSQVIHPEDLDRVLSEWEQTIHVGLPWESEHRLLDKDGRVTWVNSKAVLNRNTSEQLIGAVGMMFDISQHKTAAIIQNRQIERESAFRRIIQKIHKSLDLENILTTAVNEIQHLVNADRVIILRPNAEGDRLNVIATNAEDPLVATSLRSNFCFSSACYNQYMHGVREIIPKDASDCEQHCLYDLLYAFRSKSSVIAPIVLPFNGRAASLWGFAVATTHNEQHRWNPIEAEFLQDLGIQLAIAIEKAELYEKVQKELTAHKQTEEQLQLTNAELIHATHLKDEFLANMSHELRTPLNAVLGMTEGLQDGIFGAIEERQLNALKTIERSGYHLLELITDILDVAKIESGKMELDYAPVPVVPLCQSSLAFIKQQAFKKGIQIATNFPPDLPDLYVDERRIRQVLINLLNNAVKFTPEGGRITLEVTHKQQQKENSPLLEAEGMGERSFLRIAIVDTGIGIAPEDISKLFRPFIQIDSNLNRKYTGTGLGLVLVKQIVELHGGHVGLTSEVGVGSCFAIDLPCTDFVPSSTNKTQPQSSKDTKQAEKASSNLILLAENNEAKILTVSNYLSAIGYSLLLARTGQIAIDLARSEHPNLILMDIQLPGVDGFEAIRQIRYDPYLVDVPILALTALDTPAERDRCLQAGANDYLTKPVRLQQLAATIQQLLAT
ncbi:histidine kinase [Tumidithrix helvetica PCC 7403]|uniref:hybrid sensor histidine kinase/response regulator n=1 Tax=Tumidithrix helvetica TaxID=3457545 RepID=UPI003C7F60CA